MTPFHFGPALALGLPLRKYLHAPTLIVASVAMDVEPFLVLVLDLDYPLHGYLHTLLGAAALGLVLGLLMRALEGLLGDLWKSMLLGPPRDTSLRPFIAAGVLGAASHILLDAPIHREMVPFYPLPGNPLYNPELFIEVDALCIITGVLGLAYYLYLLFTELK